MYLRRTTRTQEAMVHCDRPLVGSVGFASCERSVTAGARWVRLVKPLAASLPPGKLNRVKCRLHDRFRLNVPADVEGWGAEEELRFERISSPREC